MILEKRPQSDDRGPQQNSDNPQHIRFIQTAAGHQCHQVSHQERRTGIEQRTIPQADRDQRQNSRGHHQRQDVQPASAQDVKHGRD